MKITRRSFLELLGVVAVSPLISTTPTILQPAITQPVIEQKSEVKAPRYSGSSMSISWSVPYQQYSASCVQSFPLVRDYWHTFPYSPPTKRAILVSNFNSLGVKQSKFDEWHKNHS